MKLLILRANVQEGEKPLPRINLSQELEIMINDIYSAIGEIVILMLQ